ncbi:MAG: MerR family transcriptional regulator [Elusimicrobiota bacterium]|nr:MerR family transcriptional regulator [Elusimicrobiota bacterium]
MTIILPDKDYFSIGEVAKITQIPQYVLRYWEKEFTILHPQRRSSGHRKYSREDINLILKIKDLLYNKKYTIQGAKKVLSAERQNKPAQLKFELKESAAAVELLKETKKTLQEILKLLK